MPNTSPVADSPSTIAWIKDRAAESRCVNVLPTGAISKNLAGEELAPIGSLAQAGVVAITDDGHCIQNHEVMRRAVEYARMVGLPVLDHCQDYNLVGNGVVHEGYWSTLLGLPGWPARGRGSDCHAQHSARGTLRSSHSLPAHQRGRQRATDSRSAGARRKNQRRSLSASHRVDGRGDPELRHELQDESAAALAARRRCATRRHRRWHACRFLRADHAPHADFEKEVEFDAAPFGIVGLETELGLFIDLLVHKHQTIDIAAADRDVSRSSRRAC